MNIRISRRGLRLLRHRVYLGLIFFSLLAIPAHAAERTKVALLGGYSIALIQQNKNERPKQDPVSMILSALENDLRHYLGTDVDYLSDDTLDVMIAPTGLPKADPKAISAA